MARYGYCPPRRAAPLRDGSLVYAGQDLYHHRYDAEKDEYIVHPLTIKRIEATEEFGKYRLYHGPGGKEIYTVGGLTVWEDDEDE